MIKRKKQKRKEIKGYEIKATMMSRVVHIFSFSRMIAELIIDWFLLCNQENTLDLSSKY